MKSLTKKEKFYYAVRSRLGVIRNDLRKKYPLGLAKRLKMWKLGFIGDKYVAYNLAVNNPKDYTSDFQEVMARFINQPYAEVLNNKLIFEMVYSKYVRVPRTLALLDDGYYIEYPTLDNRSFSQHTDVYEAIVQLAKQHGRLVIKPVRGAMGTGVMLLERTDSEQLVINGQIRSKEELKEHFQGLRDYFVSEYIEQAGYSKILYPHALNTMRLFTMVCPERNEPFLAAAVKKIGTDKSAPLDNNSIGGMAAAIDMESGVLSAASQFLGNRVTWFKRHPDSGALIEGVIVPNWADVKNKILEVAGALPFIKYVGWDVVEQDGGIVILEGNNHPQSRLLQMHKPLLKDSRVANFYRFHGLLNMKP